VGEPKEGDKVRAHTTEAHRDRSEEKGGAVCGELEGKVTGVVEKGAAQKKDSKSCRGRRVRERETNSEAFRLDLTRGEKEVVNYSKRGAGEQ